MKKSKQNLYEISKHDEIKLEYIPWNRPVTLRRNLIKSIQKLGFLVPIIIVITDIIDGVKTPWLVDGQHRKLAAFELGLPVTAVVYEEKFTNIAEFVKYVANLNSTSNPWLPVDYVRAFARNGYEDYKTLMRIHAKYSYYSIPTIASLLHGIRKRAGGGVTKVIQDGTFQVHHLEATKRTLKLGSKLTKYEKLTNRMILALHYVSNMKDFSEEVFIENYKQNADSIKELQLNDFTNIFSGWRK